ncbi:MAG: tetratricopeptide repeat protein [Rubrivivax sp.]|nr:tetratricopeptide repeat protein [Rubrivivax sp.]
MVPAEPAATPRLRLLGTVALVAPQGQPFADERRFRLALYLALAPGPVPRDTLATLFWPERAQAAARSNLRKLLMELRALALPGLVDDGDALHWPVAHDVGAETWAPPLQGLSGGDSPAFEAWLAERRQALQDSWCHRALAQARAQLETDAHAALAGARQVLQADALHEGAGRLVEAALLALGRSHEAASWRAQFAHRLRAELGVRWPAAAEAAADRDEPLLGRRDELLTLRGLLEDRRCRLITLTGPGGVGKSTLALALLQEPGLSAEAAWWVALEDLADTALVLPRIARELGVALGPASDGWAEVLAHLPGRQALLLLDNAEHLPGLPALLRRLLDAVPTLRCLATSRVRLGLDDEWLLPVAPLPPQAARQLFLRAARAAPWRQPIAADDALLPPLVEALGRLPLALALAATWTRHLALPALLQEAQSGLDLLAAAQSPDEHPAHASLRATFERSWQFLAPELRPVLAALSVGVGTLPLHVAQALGPASAAQLATLADASLLTMGSDGRVGLHPLLRQFAAEKLGAGRGAARRRHLQALAALMAPWKDFDETDGGAALAAITPELGNVLLAWDAALEFEDAGALADMAEGLGHVHQTQGGIARVLPRFEQAEALLAGRREPAALCRVALEHAALRFWLADYAGVERSARGALRAAREARLPRAKRQALNVLALSAMRRGRNEEAATWLGQALALARAEGAAREAAVYAGNLCAPLRELGRLEEADALAQSALRGYREAAHAVGELAVLNELGLIAHQRGALDAAFGWYEQALAVAARQSMPLRRPVLLTHQASVRLDQGRGTEALALAEAAGAEVERAGARSHAPTQLRLLAEALLACGRVAEAAEPLRAAWALLQRVDGSSRSRGFLCSCAAYALAQGRAAEALVLCEAAGQRSAAAQPMLARYRRLRETLLALVPSPAAPPDDMALQRAIEHLLG